MNARNMASARKFVEILMDPTNVVANMDIHYKATTRVAKLRVRSISFFHHYYFY